MRVPAWQLSILGHAIGQAAVVASTIAVARLAEPSVMGGYQVALSVALVIVPLATLRLESVAPSMERRQSSATLRFATAVSLFASFLIMAGGLLALLSSQAWCGTALGAGLLVAAQSLTLIDNSALLHGGHYKRLAARNLLAGVFTALTQTAAVIVWPAPLALAIAFVLARALAVAFTRPCRRRRRRIAKLDSDGSRSPTTVMPPDAVSWRNITTAVVGYLGLQLPVVLLGLLWGAAAAGQAGAALRLAGAPSGFLGQGLQQAMLGRLSALRRESGQLTPELVRHVRWMAPLAALMIVTLVPLGEPITVALLGDEWSTGGRMVSVMAIPLALQVVAAPMQVVFPILRADRIALSIAAVRSTLLLCGIVVTWAVGAGPLAAVAVWSSVLTVGYVTVMVWTFKLAVAHDAVLEPHRGGQQ